MTWIPDVLDADAAALLSRRFRLILTQLETGDFLAASDALRHWADESPLEELPEEVVSRIRLCVMDARADLIHMEPDAARAHIRQALQLATSVC